MHRRYVADVSSLQRGVRAGVQDRQSTKEGGTMMWWWIVIGPAGNAVGYFMHKEYANAEAARIGGKVRRIRY